MLERFFTLVLLPLTADELEGQTLLPPSRRTSASSFSCRNHSFHLKLPIRSDVTSFAAFIIWDKFQILPSILV